MTCISPVYVRKAGGFVPCGRCAFCIKKAIDAWCLRLAHEMEDSSSAFFFTLTYSDENLSYSIKERKPTLVKSHLQDFFRSLRKKNPGIRYFAIGEYGTNYERPHYHAIIFNLELDYANDLVTRSWFRGFVQGSRATLGRIRYTVQYMALPALGSWPIEGTASPFRIMSRRPGIGFNYVQKKNDFIDAEKTA